MLAELSNVYAEWRRAKLMLFAAENARVPTEPKQPTHIESEQEWLDYTGSLKAYEDTKAASNDRVWQHRYLLSQKDTAVLKAIPIRGCLFKVEYLGQYFGICAYFENSEGFPRLTWSDLPWEDGLEPKPDETQSTGAVS